MRIRRIRHVTLAVHDLDRARETFQALLGAEPGQQRALDDLGVQTIELALGEDTLQLAAPAADGPLRRFIDRHGEAFYALALEVEDLDAAIVELRGYGVRVSEPAELEPGKRSVFVAMAATHGLSIQLVESPPSVDAPPGEAAPAQPPEQRPLLDLSPDEWSDVD